MLAAAIAFLLLGVALTTRGLIGRRLGDEPRCRKCKYNLTGVESKECPECGRRWTPETVARGLRHRLKLALTAGITLLLPGGALLTPAARSKIQRTNFYQYMPTAIVIPAAARASTDAFSVLQDRFNRNKLDPAQLQQLIEAGLTVQAAPSTNANTQDWIELLAQLEANSRLSAEQRTRFYRQMVGVEVLLPKVIRVPPSNFLDLPIWITKRFRCDAQHGYIWRADVSIVLDGTTVLADHQFVSDGSMYSKRYSDTQEAPDIPLTLNTTALSPGTHRLLFKLDTSLYGVTTSPIPILCDGQETLAVEFELLPAEAPDPVSVVADETTVATLRNSLEIRATMAAAGLLVEARVAKPAPCDAVLVLNWPGRQPKRGRLLQRRFVEDEKRSLRVHEGSTTETFPLSVVDMSPTHSAGSQLTIEIESTGFGLEPGAGRKRLTGGLKLQPITVTIQSSPVPAPAATGS